MDKMNLDEMIEKLENPNVDAFTCFTYELVGFLKELKDRREENKVLIQECDRLIKEKGELLKKTADMKEIANMVEFKKRMERE